MNTDEIEITHLFAEASPFCAQEMFGSVAELGQNAGSLTWSASRACAASITPPLLNTDERKDAFRDFARDSGGWTREEIAAWNDEELNALLLQWIAGDVREAFGDAEFSEWDWAAYETDDRAAHRLFKAADGRIFFYIGN